MLSLVETNLLIGGEPGSAKSNLVHLIAARALLDPAAQLYVLDPKLVELRRYRHLAAGFAGPEIDEATSLLRRVEVEMAARYRRLDESGARKFSLTDGVGHVVVLIDEVAIYTTDPDKKAAAELTALVRKLVALGRAAGVVVVLATQRPSTDVVSSSLRDLVAIRCALRCSTRDASDTIFGAGWAAQGYSAAEIDAGRPGVCLLLGEGGMPRLLRCYHLDDAALDTIIARAEELRR